MTDETPVVVEAAPKPRRIAMIGCAPSTRNEAPWNEPTWEIWSQSEAFQVPRLTRWFELMPLNRLKAEYADYYNWLTKLDKPLHMRRHYDEFPASIPIQREAFEREYPSEFLSSTVAWMMAEAIDQHARGQHIEAIGLWGYDMAMDAEWFSQRPGIKFFTWVAHKHKIAVYFPNGSDLAISPMSYPFFADDPELAKVRARMNDIQKKRAFARSELQKNEMTNERLRAQINYFGGAEEQLIYEERRLTGSRVPV